MSGQHGIGGTFHEPLIIANYHVATNPELVPDCSCNYFLAGTFGGYTYYRRADGLRELWRFHAPVWYITALHGEFSGPCWVRNSTNILGNYTPMVGAVGIATVSAGPH